MKHDDIDAFKRSGAPHDERPSFFSNQGAGLRELALGASSVGVQERSVPNLDITEPDTFAPAPLGAFEDEAVELLHADPVSVEPISVEAIDWSSVSPTLPALPVFSKMPTFPPAEPTMRSMPHRSTGGALTVVLSRSLAAKVFFGVSISACLLFVAGTFMGLTLGRVFPELNMPPSGPQVASLQVAAPVIVGGLASGPLMGEGGELPLTLYNVQGDAPEPQITVTPKPAAFLPVTIKPVVEVAPTAVLTVASVPATPALAAPVSIEALDEGAYSVQVGAFLVSDNVEPLIAMLSDLDIVAHHSQRIDAQGRTWHYVRSNTFANKDGAARLANEMRAQGVAGFVVLQDEGQL